MGGHVGNGALENKGAVAIFVEPLLDGGLENKSEKSAAIWSPGQAPDPILKCQEGAASHGMPVEAN